MKVYNYTDDKIFYGESEAQPSPAEPGKFLIPRNATTIEPPSLEVNQQAYWNGSTWEIQNIVCEKINKELKTFEKCIL
jgi:hypothetical protein